MYWRYMLLVKKSNRLIVNELSLDSKGELTNKSDKLDSLVKSKSLFATWLRISEFCSWVPWILKFLAASGIVVSIFTPCRRRRRRKLIFSLKKTGNKKDKCDV